MSNNESLDEETKRILAEVQPDAQSGSNDSKESSKKKYPNKTITIIYDDEGNETNTSESPDSEW